MEAAAWPDTRAEAEYVGFQPEVEEREESRTSRWTFPSERVTPVVAVRLTASEAATSASTANLS